MKPHTTRTTLSQRLQSLDILSFNVEGLDSMLLDPDFLKLTQEHDICLLSETMRKEDTKLNIENFWDFSQIRPKCTKKGRNSGGITILVKSPLRGGIKVVHSSEGLVWIKLDKSFFNFEEDLYICAELHKAPQTV